MIFALSVAILLCPITHSDTCPPNSIDPAVSAAVVFDKKSGLASRDDDFRENEREEWRTSKPGYKMGTSMIVTGIY
jgi:hypothetical protein